MAQTEYKFDNPTEVTNPQGQKITLQPGTHYLGQGWIPTPTDPVSSTDPIREDMTLVKNEANKALGDIGNSGNLLNSAVNDILNFDFSMGGAVGEREDELDQLRKSFGMLNTQEEQSIRDEGQRVYDQFAPLISEAEASKRQGLPKSVIGAGERGGFMSTQFAGGAALQTTEGGTFLGEGGELNRIKSDYDRNISLIQGQAKQARSAAEAAARQAIQTGKRQDYEVLERSLERLKQTSRDLMANLQARADAVYQYSNFQRENQQFQMLLEDRDIARQQGDEDRAMALEDRAKNQAIDRLNAIMSSLGVDGIISNRATIEPLFNQIGFEGINFDDVIAKLQADEQAAIMANAPKPELRTVGSKLYSVSWNESTGQFDTKLLATGTTGGGGGSTGGLTAEEKAFYADVDQGLKDLRAGANWGEVWNKLKAKYGAPNEVLDQLLNKEVWGERGDITEKQGSTVKK